MPFTVLEKSGAGNIGQSHGGKGVINIKTAARNGKAVSIMLVNETSEVMAISQFGKVTRINSTTAAIAGAARRGVRACCIWRELS